MNPRASETTFHQAVKEFLVEAGESLEEIERHLVELERDPSADARSSGAVGRMFRILHSLKGSCGFLKYPKIEELAHVGEGLLGRVRDGMLPISPTVITAMLSVTDAIREILGHVEAENNEGDKDYSDLTQHVSQFCDSEDLPNPFATATDASGPAAEAARDGFAQEYSPNSLIGGQNPRFMGRPNSGK